MKKWLSLGLLFWAVAAQAEPCRVVGVSDGDTITVRCMGRAQERIRIAEIDAPEKKQAFGMRAKAKASELAFGKLIELTAAGHDRYGRTIGYVQLPDGSDFGTEMIRSGLAWRYVAYSKNELLSNVENEARRQRLGLWSDPGVVAPWTYRKTRHPRRAKVH